MDERIFRPLEIKDTSYFIPQAKESRVAGVYTEENGKLKRDPRDIFRRGNTYAAPESGLYSTAPDLYRFYQMMLNRETFGDKRILSAAAVELMTTPQLGDKGPTFAPGLGMGLGFAVVRDAEGMYRYQSMGAFGHGGAFRTYGWIDPRKDLVGVILLQRTNGGGDTAEEINSMMTLAAAAIEK